MRWSASRRAPQCVYRPSLLRDDTPPTEDRRRRRARGRFEIAPSGPACDGDQHGVEWARVGCAAVCFVGSLRWLRHECAERSAFECSYRDVASPQHADACRANADEPAADCDANTERRVTPSICHTHALLRAGDCDAGRISHALAPADGNSDCIASTAHATRCTGHWRLGRYRCDPTNSQRSDRGCRTANAGAVSSRRSVRGTRRDAGH